MLAYFRVGRTVHGVKGTKLRTDNMCEMDSTNDLEEEEEESQSFSFARWVKMLTKRRTMFLFWFLGALAVLAVAGNAFMLASMAMVIVAAYVANWCVTLAANKLPKKYVSDLEYRAVLITGCDSGFGQQLALRLNAMGVLVYAGVLNDDSEGAKMLKAMNCPKMKVVPFDVTSDSDVRRAATFVNTDLGERKLQAIVNNAGVTAVTEVEWCPLETYREVLEVNALGPIRVTQNFLPILRKGVGSRVVVVASLAGRYTFPGFTAYSMSKSAAVSFADGLRREMKKWSITVHTIEPTLYKTPLTKPTIIQGTMQTHWDSSTDTVRKTYGEEYFEDFKRVICGFLKKARGPQQIAEVIDDMVDAVIGDEPRMRYVPSVAAEFRAQVITAMPLPLQDLVLCLAQPRTPPAAVSAMQRRKEYPLERTLTRLRSVPSWFHKDRNFFQFPDTRVNGKKEPTIMTCEEKCQVEQNLEEEVIAES